MAVSTKSVIILVIVLLLIAGAGAGIYFLVKHIQNSKKPSTINNTNGNGDNSTNQ